LKRNGLDAIPAIGVGGGFRKKNKGRREKDEEPANRKEAG